MAGMNHLRFSLYTLLGAGIWCTVLTGIGYLIGENQELIMRYAHRALLITVLCCVLLVAVYIRVQRRRNLPPCDIKPS